MIDRDSRSLQLQKMTRTTTGHADADLSTEGNMAKFSQNEGLRTFLLSTGNQVLVEASPYDRIWGIGHKATNENARHPDTWQGQNLLGFALMDVRAELSDSG